MQITSCRTLLAIALFFLQAANLTSATLCYNPNGSVSNDVPCNSTASVSVCCTQGFICTANMLCQPQGWYDNTTGNPLQLIRGTCTDETWSSNKCPGYCAAESVTGGEWVMRCGKNSTSYCCSADDCCSDSSVDRLTLPDPDITATAGIAPTTTATTASASTQTRSSATTSETSTSTASNDSTTSGSHSKTIGIGVGVGVGAGVVILGSLAGLIFWRRGKTKKADAAYIASLPQQSQPPEFFPQELDSTGLHKMEYPQELDLTNPQELDSTNPQELDSTNPPGYAHGNRQRFEVQ